MGLIETIRSVYIFTYTTVVVIYWFVITLRDGEIWKVLEILQYLDIFVNPKNNRPHPLTVLPSTFLLKIRNGWDFTELQKTTQDTSTFFYFLFFFQDMIAISFPLEGVEVESESLFVNFYWIETKVS